MSYTETLTSQQKKNIDTIIDSAIKSGITNPNAIAGMLAIVSKESSFVPKSEILNYSPEQIQKVFKLSSARAQQLAHNPEALGNAVYGGRGGNSANEGYKYRGRGFNQLTFKNAYKFYGDKIGVDLLANPDKLNNVDVASKVLIDYNKVAFDSLKKNGKLSAYNSDDINDFQNTEDATMAFYHATAGTGKETSYVKSLKKNDPLKGMTLALKRVNDLYDYVKKFTPSSGNFGSDRLKNAILISVGLIASYILYKTLNKKK
jgi:hypothetical protein